MAINSKVPITAISRIRPIQGRKGSASPIQGFMASYVVKSMERARQAMPAPGFGKAVRWQGMDNKRDSFVRDGGGVGTGAERTNIEPTPHNYFSPKRIQDKAGIEL